VNYLAHFFFYKEEDNPYHNCGLIFPDWIAAYKRSRLNPKIVTRNEQEEALYSGIQKHLLADKIFHGSPYFMEYTNGIKLLLEESGLDKDKFRFSFLAHIILEMMIDRLLLLKYTDLGTSFYDNLDACDDDLLVYFAQRNSKVDDGFKTLVEKFKLHRFLLSYVNTDNFVYSLNRITGRVGITFNEAHGRQLHERVKPIEAYVSEGLPSLFRLFEGV
jgi:hypothetical protein